MTSQLIRRKTEEAEKITLSVIVERLSLLLFGRIAAKLVKGFELSRPIKEAAMEVFPVVYAAKLLFYTFTTFAIGFIIFIFVYILTPLDYIVKLLVLVFSIVTALLVFGIGLSYPYIKRGAREKSVESELPYFAAYMTLMAFGGAAPEKIIEKVAGLRVFKALREEAMRIIRDIKVFGMDPLTAIERNAYDHPSRTYRELMLGYTTTVRTGGDVLHYLEIKTSDIFRSYAEVLRSLADKIGLVVEAYIAIAIIGTLSFYIFFVVSGIIPAAGQPGMGGLAGILLYTFILMPTLTVLMIFIIDSSQPKTPIYHREPYAWLILSIPLSILVFILLLPLSGAVKIFLGAPLGLGDVINLIVVFSLSLITASLPPAYTFISISKKIRRLHHTLAEFMRDLAEVRKTGLSPEKSIIMLSSRDYGALTSIVRRIAGALSVGLSVETAIKRALRGYRDWFLLVNMRILIDAIDVGGGSPQMFDTLARYVSSLASFIDELRRRLRTYAFMPYFGSILISVSSVVTLIMLVQAVSGAELEGTGLATGLTAKDITLLLIATTVGSVFNSWLMGLIVGKVQSMMTAAGFIHATVLAIVTMLISIATLIFFGPQLPGIS